MDYDTLASYIFNQNEMNHPVALHTPNIDDSFQLFSFCVHMTIQGIMMDSTNSQFLDIENIPIERIDYVGKKMENAGIKLRITIDPVDATAAVEQQSKIEMRQKNHVKDLQDIALFIYTKKATYTLTFSLVRNCALIETCHACEKIDLSSYK